MKHIKLFESFSREENMAKSYTLEFLPKFWEDLDIKRPAYLGGDEAGHSLLNRDNTIELTVGDDPITIYRRDTRMYDDKGRKAGRGDDSIWYTIKLYRTHGEFTENNNMLKYSLDFQEDTDAKLGGNMNLTGLGTGEFKSDEVGSMDSTKRLKIVAVD
jgi:hypothetical protein